MFLYRFVDRKSSSYVVDYAADIERKFARGNFAVADRFDKLFFCALRIFEHERLNDCSRKILDRFFHFFDRVGLVRLYSDESSIDFKCFFHDLDTDQDLFSPFEHDPVVSSEVRLAFDRVDYERICFFAFGDRVFYVSREARAAHSDDSHFLHRSDYLFGSSLDLTYHFRRSDDALFPFVSLVYIDDDRLRSESARIFDSVDREDSSAYRRVDVDRNEAARLADQSADFNFVALLDYRSSRCTDVLRKKDGHPFRKLDRFDRSPRAYFVCRRMNAALFKSLEIQTLLPKKLST